MSSPLEQLPNSYRAFFGAFSSLTSAQTALIRPILLGDDVILQAGTGSGKTEAVLAPATEKLILHRGEFTILYIVPTRALAADMQRRVRPIYRQLGLKSGFRTGDGKQLRGAKPDLLIMTPESLDVLLGSKNEDDRGFLKRVQFMVLDEVHVFLEGERGIQLAHLRRRLDRMCGRGVQIAAMSATLSDEGEVESLFELKRKPFCFKEPSSRKLHPRWVHLEDEERELTLFFDDLFRHFNCRKLLAFAPSRRECERLCELLNREGLFAGKAALHYSNLSAKERRGIESSFRKQKIGVCFATSTLELGIDIGDIDAVVLMSPPESTKAFLQRVGRSNRGESSVNFWGVCSGAHAARQLIQFLALFELAEHNQLEKTALPRGQSVLFQQILSSLYAKRLLSLASLKSLLPRHQADLPPIFQAMVAKNWLQPAGPPGLYRAGWRYFRALKKRRIWSNLPQTEEEYAVMLEGEKLAVLPLSTVKQLERGDLIQLMGKLLRVVSIEEKEGSGEVETERAESGFAKKLPLRGSGAPISLDLAQKMKEILFGEGDFPGLFKRTKELLEGERKKRAEAVRQQNGMLVYRLESGAYRYETFLGSIGNFMLYHLVQAQWASKGEGLSLSFDPFGLESREWIPFHALGLPHTVEQVDDWTALNLPLLRMSFPWNSWIYWLPEEQQQKEIGSYLFDSRLLEQFQRYRSEAMEPPPPQSGHEESPLTGKEIPLQGEPWSPEKERAAWGRLSFPELPLDQGPVCPSLSGSQLQGYVKQQLCPRWARFQQLNYRVNPHPRFSALEEEVRSRKERAQAFKREVVEALAKEGRLFRAEAGQTWRHALFEVAASGQPLFFAEAKLDFEAVLRGVPDLIYIKPLGPHLLLEVWDILHARESGYAKKWKVSFYAHLLEQLINKEASLPPVRLSEVGGLILPSGERDRLFKKSPFSLAPYRAWMPRLIAEWKRDSMRSSALQERPIEPSCTGCAYFSYCYQEVLEESSAAPPGPPQLILQAADSIEFPKQSKHWYFLDYDCKGESLRWQCWEGHAARRDESLHRRDFLSEREFLEEAANRLKKQWERSLAQGKCPHFLVYEPADWRRFQKSFQATSLHLLWSIRSCCTSIQTVLKNHFSWPIWGRLTPVQVGACLGLVRAQPPPLSLYHRHTGSGDAFELYRQIWSWCLSKVKSRRSAPSETDGTGVPALIRAYLALHEREVESRRFEILEFQRRPLSERVEQFRAIGPMSFLGVAATCRREVSFRFSIDPALPASKFRTGDFLKLSPVESARIQEGLPVILDSYAPEKGVLSVRPLSRRARLSPHQAYVLDENADDWNAPKIEKVLHLLKDAHFRPEVLELLLGRASSAPCNAAAWAEEWHRKSVGKSGLNALQKEALLLPFREKIGLIEGPPGTGKTHLLVWTLAALIARAESLKAPIKILVTAQTHHAIDQILKKAAALFPRADLPSIPLWKYGQFDEKECRGLGVHPLPDGGALQRSSRFLLGATGFGIYRLLASKKFPKVFDWVVFDESSQILPPYALLSLIFGKGRALFYGDTQQLPPVLTGKYEEISFAPRSILKELLSRYGERHRVRLRETYRMNREICRFPSDAWYEGELHSALPESDQRLALPNYPLFGDLLDEKLDPSRPLTLVQLDHEGCRHSSPEEAAWIAVAVKRLVEEYSVPASEIGIISPHRLHNHAILSALKESLTDSSALPRIDTVERMQGAEFDLVIFSAAVSDKEMLHSPFLKGYQRFNVALTRARKKFLFVASPLFFSAFPRNEQALAAQMPFENFFSLCTGLKKES